MQWLPEDGFAGTLVGRAWVPGDGGPTRGPERRGLARGRRVRPVGGRAHHERPARDGRPGGCGSQDARPPHRHCGQPAAQQPAARQRWPVPPGALRPAGHQGGRRHLRCQPGRTRDRGAGQGRRGAGRGDPRPGARGAGRLAGPHRARLGQGAGTQGAAGAPGPVVAVSRGGHRSRRRGVHQGAGAVGRGHGRGDRHPPRLGLEQPRTGSGAGRQQPRRDQGRGPGQRRQPARLRRPQRAAAGQGQGQQRVLRDRALHPAVRRAASRSRTCATAP